LIPKTFVVCLALVTGLSTVSILRASQNPGAVFLMIWPTARSTGLAGAMTALADEQDAAYWNPGGLGFQRSLGATVTGAPWLPGLYPGMFYGYASGGFGIGEPFGQGSNLNLGANVTYLTTGETDVVNERGEFLGRYTTWDAAFGIHGGLALSDKLGLGANLKYVHSFLVPEWVWKVMPELGIEAGGTGRSVAIDAGALYKPWRFLNVGVTLANLGPNISYTSSGESDPLPATLRLGLCFTPIDDPLLRVRGLVEFDKILVGMFYDTTGTKSSGRLWNEEMRDAWKSAAFEATVLQLVSARVGYFEDLTGQRGGFVMEKEGQTYHYGLGDLLTRNDLGTPKSIGLCLGLGIGYKDYARLEVSSDALIYDFKTDNWKLALTLNDLGGLMRDLSRGMSFDWLP